MSEFPNTKLFVGNLPFEVTEEDLEDLFNEIGEVEDVALIHDKFSGRPRGFAFITMDCAESAEEAIDEFEGAEFMGRTLKVNLARPREEMPPRPNAQRHANSHIDPRQRPPHPNGGSPERGASFRPGEPGGHHQEGFYGDWEKFSEDKPWRRRRRENSG